MPIDLTQSLRWTKASADEKAMLRDLQGNILKGHGRERTLNLFLRFDDPSAKAWIAQISSLVTSAEKQLSDAAVFRAAKAAGKRPGGGGAFVAFYLSAAGYKALGVPQAAQPKDAAFQQGMKARGAGLADPAPEAWDEHYRGEVHAMLLIGGESAEIKEIEQQLKPLPGSVRIIGREEGLAYKNKNLDGVEHFGYVDGRSQPLVLKEDVEREKFSTDGINVWNPEFPLSQVLVPDPGVPDKRTAFGSYFVFRKLEQNVAGFKAREAELGELLVKEAEKKAGKALPAKQKAKIEERAGALIVGRFEDGTPTTLQHDEGAHHPVLNNFDYRDDPEGTKCPFHAHIRKTNPRGESSAVFGVPLEAERAHIMARRGITYGKRKALPSKHGVEFAEDDRPERGVGLLFMAFMRDMGNQFEFTQASWSNNPDFVRPDTGIDPVIGQGGPGGQSCPMSWGKLPGETEFTKFDFRGFVTLKGGEYFFAPCIPTLKNL